MPAFSQPVFDLSLIHIFFSKVDKVGSLRPRSIDLMCRKDKPDFSANCSCFNFRERRNKRIVIPKDF